MLFLLAIATSSCTTTYFGGMLIDPSSRVTVGGAIERLVLHSVPATTWFTLGVEGEAGCVFADTPMANHQLNLKLTAWRLNESFSSSSRIGGVGGYLIGGVGWLDEDVTPNWGGGLLYKVRMWKAEKHALEDVAPYNAFRVDYRYFFHDEHPVHRVYFGITGNAW